MIKAASNRDLAPPDPLVLDGHQVRALVSRLDGVQIHFNTLSLWVNTGLVAASVRSATYGRGNHRLFSRSDVARIRLIVHLKRAGVSGQKIRTVLARLDADPTLASELLNPGTHATVIVNRTSGNAVLVYPGGPDVELLTGQTRLPLRAVVVGIQEEGSKLVA